MLPEWKAPRPKREPSRKLATPRIGPRMRELQAVTSVCPGISKAAALRAADLPDRGMGSHRPIDRAIAAGLLVVEYEHANRCRLFANERDRAMFHLRGELLATSSSARADEIMGVLGVLRAAQAQTWRDSA